VPILHTQFSGQAKTQQGQVVQVPPAIILQRQGPCVQVTIGLAQSIASQLLQQGKTLPKPVSGITLIDTGATSTCIDDAAAKQLELPVVNVVNVASASHASTQQNVYPIQIEVVGLPISIEAPNAIGAALSAQGLLALIGRDVLQHCTLFYNGITGEITLSI
jgi:predicted aspartyl protease